MQSDLLKISTRYEFEEANRGFDPFLSWQMLHLHIPYSYTELWRRIYRTLQSLIRIVYLLAFQVVDLVRMKFV